MCGYNVFFHVEHSKKPYNSTEFYPDHDLAQKRALELSIASNVTLIKIFTIDFTIDKTETIKE